MYVIRTSTTYGSQMNESACGAYFLVHIPVERLFTVWLTGKHIGIGRCHSTYQPPSVGH